MLAALSPFLAAITLSELISGGAVELAASVPGIVGCTVFAAGYTMLRRHVARLFHNG